MRKLIEALDEAIRIIEGYAPPALAAVPVALGAGTGHAVTEAPRGILYHRYTIGDDGLIESAQITPPTAQNQRCIEEDLIAMGSTLASLPSTRRPAGPSTPSATTIRASRAPATS